MAHETSDADTLSLLSVAVSQSQPFGPLGVRPVGPAPFSSQPSLPGQLMPMTSPGVPAPRPSLFTPASVPSSQLPAACPLPVASQSPLDFSSPPFSCPMNMGYPQGGPGAPSTKPLPAAIPPPPTGKYCLCDLCVQDKPRWGFQCVMDMDLLRSGLSPLRLDVMLRQTLQAESAESCCGGETQQW